MKRARAPGVGVAGLMACLITGCGGPAPVKGGGNDQTPAAAAPAPAPSVNSAEPAPAANSAAPEASVEVPEDAPGLADMNPFRRRAYEKGYRDCSAGRYEPDPWPEAYRIGCGAAQERAGEPAPKG